MELPQSPTFYEDDYPYPWKPFKSNGGTGDTPVDWLQPSTTVEPTPPPVVSKLCPFRKRTWFYTSDNYNSVPEYANHMEEEFLPCLHEQCAMWNGKGERCGYNG